MSLPIDESLRKFKFLFKLSGLNLEETIQNTVADIIKFRWWFIISFLWLNTDVIGEVLWLITGILSGKPFLELTYIAPCITMCMLINFKMCFFINNEHNIKKLLKYLREMEKNSGDNEDEEKRDTIIEENKTFLNVVIRASMFWNAGTAVAFGVSPALLMALEYRKTGKLVLMIPFLVVYPIDPYDIKYWPFAYVHQIWSAFIVIIAVSAIDCLFYSCCSSISTQFRLLQYDIEGIIPERAFDDNVFKEKFKKFVVRHEEIIRSVTLLETIYTRSMLFNFMSSSLLICFTGFNATAIDDLAFVWTFLSFMLMSLLQIFLLCFFGDMIMTSSMEVSNAMYNSYWYCANAKTAKQLFLVQIRAQKPCKLTASRYADVNLRSFTRILSTAWSYFALLKTVYGSPRT